MKLYPSAWIVGAGFWILLASIVAAQTPAPPQDIVRPPLAETGSYQMTVQIPTQDSNDAAVFEACCDRMDVEPVIPLGCGMRDGVEQVISFQVDVTKTPGDDGEVRCYTVNSEGQSPYSLNAYILPFPLLPNPPIVQ